MHPKIKLLIEMGTGKLKQGLSYSKKLVDTGVGEMKKKLEEIKAPVMNSNALSKSVNYAKGLFSSAAAFFKSKLFPGKVDAPGINTAPFANGLSSLKRMALTAGVASLLTGGIGSSIASGMEASKNQVSFEVLGGKQKGGQLFSDVKGFARDSIFGNESYQNAKTLLSFGVAIDKVMPRLRMLGDISMGDKEHFNSLTLAFAQMTAAGRLMGQDVLQMVNAGFNPLQEISLMTGESMASLKKKMEDGAISTELVNKAFEHATGPMGRFYKMTEKIAGTAFGQWEALKGQLGDIAMQFGTTLLPYVIQFFQAIKPVVDMLPALLDRISPVIGALIEMGGQAFSVLQPLFELMASADMSGYIAGVKEAFNTIVSAVSPVIEELIPLFGTVIDVVWPLAMQLRDFTVHLIQRFAPTLKNIAHILTNVLGPALKVAGWLLGKIIDILSWVLDKVASVLNFVTGIFAKISDGVKWVMDKIGVTIDDGTTKAINAMQQKIQDNNVVKFFKDTGARHGQAYLDALFVKYEQAARIMDRMYNTKAWSDSVQSIKDAVIGKKGKKDTDASLVPATADGKGDPNKVDAGVAPSTPSKIAGQSAQTHNVTINFDSYIKGDMITKNNAIANMSPEQFSRWLQEHFFGLVGGASTAY